MRATVITVFALVALVAPAGCHSFDDVSVCDTDAELPMSCYEHTPQPPIRALARTLGPSNCALLQDGGVRCWGANQYGQLGDGTTTNRYRPVDIPELRGAVEVTLGVRHGCAVMENGTATCWGANESGQLGDETKISRLTPAPVRGLVNVRSMALSDADTCALLLDGTVQCWGSGVITVDGTPTQRSFPAPVQGLSGVVEIGASFAMAYATTNLDTVRWASNFWPPQAFHQRFDSLTTTQSQMCGITNATIYCWPPTFDSPFGPPAAMPQYGQAVVVAVGGGFACSLRGDGQVVCGGLNITGALGNGSLIPTQAFSAVPGIDEATAIVAGPGHVCALASRGLLCWGANDSGEVGRGNTTSFTVPTPVRVQF